MAEIELRDYFAAHAIASPINSAPIDTWAFFRKLFGFSYHISHTDSDVIARRAYEVADAMIAERTKP